MKEWSPAVYPSIWHPAYERSKRTLKWFEKSVMRVPVVSRVKAQQTDEEMVPAMIHFSTRQLVRQELVVVGPNYWRLDRWYRFTDDLGRIIENDHQSWPSPQYESPIKAPSAKDLIDAKNKFSYHTLFSRHKEGKIVVDEDGWIRIVICECDKEFYAGSETDVKLALQWTDIAKARIEEWKKEYGID